PGLTEVTPGPISSTMPPPSWPRMTGNMPSGSAPDNVNASVWQTPVATMRTRTSPAFGPSRSTCSMLSGLPASPATAPLVFIVLGTPSIFQDLSSPAPGLINGYTLPQRAKQHACQRSHPLNNLELRHVAPKQDARCAAWCS